MSNPPLPPVPAPVPPTSATAPTIACDIFCAVIDNFGDVGVCWRLARQLAAEHRWQVRLIVDDLHTFARLEPALDTELARQTLAGVTIEHWREPLHAGVALQVADIVIEAFACELPPAYIAAMARRTPPPIWFNLEYLSAEDWVADVHLKPSPHPRHALTKTFFFPGLGPGTGGVIKEQGLDAARSTFSASAPARQAWWERATLGPPPSPDATVISLFAYENPAIDALLAQWRDGDEPIVLLVPQGRISGAVARFFGLPAFAAPTHAERGNLRAHALPFVPQTAFDELLWVSHLNFVRGEDSFVRAQWARRPFVWHIYPQADAAHLPKLDAALGHYAAPLAERARTAMDRFWHAWNGAGTPDWADFWSHRRAFETRAATWGDELATVGDLASNLARFAKSQLK
ncbi:elongation factor P maturation arginine rhamnosyltransferase EarP [Trinickia sp. LjRoot230]|uniref:elongation factor P maturation arginine rhamnosyltransferase EarP n=1 Tax=Trinickia sp. LjRoot230 TaxID=3342288 RepID=UPI003ED10383